MLRGLLTNASLPDGYQEVSIGTASLYALIGFAVVFAGIAFLIFVVWGLGKLMARVQTPKKVEPAKESVSTAEIGVSSLEDAVDKETVAVIMAALTAYYEKNHPKCEFTVKRIKRVRRNDYA